MVNFKIYNVITSQSDNKIWEIFYLVVEKRFSDPFLRNQDWTYLCISLVYYFQKTKWGLELVSLPYFLNKKFLKKNISCVIFYYLNKFCCLVVFKSWDIGQNVYFSCLLTKLNVINFEINLIFLIKRFFLHDRNFKL